MNKNNHRMVEIVTGLSSLSGARVAVALARGKTGKFQVVSGDLKKGINLEELSRKVERRGLPGGWNYYQENGIFVLPWQGREDERGLVVGSRKDEQLAKALSAVIELWEKRWKRESEDDNLAEEITSRYEQMVLSYRLSREIGTIENPGRMLRVLLDCLLKVVGTREGFLVYSPEKGRCEEMVALVNEKTGGKRESALTHTLREKLAAICLLQDQPFIANDLDRDPGLKKLKPRVSSLMFCPLQKNDNLLGALILINKIDRTGFLTDDLKLVSSIGGQAATALENARLSSDLHGLFVGITEALAAAIDARDPYTAGHSRSVTRSCLALAENLGVSREQKIIVHLAGLLHDVGKVGVREAVLTKPTRLTESEFAEVKRHPEIGIRILGHIPQLAEVIPIIRHHHERFDGTGYPDGIAGEQIPLESRIIAVANSFDAMMNDRAYRKAIGLKKTREELSRKRGTQFDPRLVDTFLKMDISSLVVKRGEKVRF